MDTIDPGPCRVRHIVRGAEGDPSAQPLGRVYFVRDDVIRRADGLNGANGWQQAECTLTLSDDGNFTLVLPNDAGPDGILHKRRFAVITDPAYEPGEEWIEIWSDFDQSTPIFVGTPVDYEKSKTTVTIKGADLNVVLDGSLSSDVDVWDGTAPADVLGHYSRIPVLARGTAPVMDDFTGGGPDVVTANFATDDVARDCWTTIAHTIVRQTPGTGGVFFALHSTEMSNGVSGIDSDIFLLIELNVRVGTFVFAYYWGGGNRYVTDGKRLGLVDQSSVEIRIVARYDRIFAFVNGELLAELRRPGAWPVLTSVGVGPFSSVTIQVDRIHVETLLPFAARGPSASLQRRLPGIPPATGLRGRYWGVGALYAQYTDDDLRATQLFPLAADPVADRLDTQLNFPTGTAAYPPAIPGAYAARWTGAVYLDLEASDCKLRLSGLVGRARIYVGRTLRGDDAASSWSGTAPTTLTTAALRAWLGTSESGWYPLLVEQVRGAAEAGIVLQQANVDSSGAVVGSWSTVPQSQLSPIGCYDDIVRNTPHRTIIGNLAESFGYQWRTVPRSLESGEFPGQYEFASLIGRQTRLVIDDEQLGSEASAAGSSRDVVDAITADAAGIADPKGSGQLSAQVVDYGRAPDHMVLRQSYESLADITESPLLVTRIDSLLVLRSSPNEQVGVRPGVQVEMVEAFELLGDVAKLKWEPGDGVLLKLDSVDVTDTAPRQMTSVTWSPKPDGLGLPVVSFRSRPRSPKAALKRLRAAIFGPRRTYQGSRAVLTGTIGGTGGAADGYSRAPLPANLEDIIKVVAVVQVLEGSGWRLEVNDVDLGSPAGDVTQPDRYDITSIADRYSNNGPYILARLIGGTGNYRLTLEIWIRV